MNGAIRRDFEYLHREAANGESFGILTNGEITRMIIRAGEVLAYLEIGSPEGMLEKQLSQDIDLALAVKEYFEGLLWERSLVAAKGGLK